MKVLVTDAGGYTGKFLLKRFLKEIMKWLSLFDFS